MAKPKLTIQPTVTRKPTPQMRRDIAAMLCDQERMVTAAEVRRTAEYLTHQAARALAILDDGTVGLAADGLIEALRGDVAGDLRKALERYHRMQAMVTTLDQVIEDLKE